MLLKERKKPWIKESLTNYMQMTHKYIYTLLKELVNETLQKLGWRRGKLEYNKDKKKICLTIIINN